MFEKLTVLDGGFATEYEKSAKQSLVSVTLWSSRLLETHQEDVKKVHKNFLEAGADVIETNTYKLCVRTALKLGLDPKQMAKTAVQLAQKAVEEYHITNDRPITIAGSIGPYCGVFEQDIADGKKSMEFSEYGGKYVDECSFEDMVQYHVEQGSLLVESGCDLLAYETIPAAREGQAVLKALDKLPEYTKAWVAFSCKSSTETGHGDDVVKAIDECLDHPKVVAAGVNCCNPAFVSPILSNVINKHNKPLVVYPNSGEMYSYINGWSGAGEKAASWAHHVDEWTTLGAKLIGGCCRVYSDDINTISKKINMINNSKK